MKYVIKSVQVKGFTRTRKGKIERVKSFSREQKMGEPISSKNIGIIGTHTFEGYSRSNADAFGRVESGWEYYQKHFSTETEATKAWQEFDGRATPNVVGGSLIGPQKGVPHIRDWIHEIKVMTEANPRYEKTFGEPFSEIHVADRKVAIQKIADTIRKKYREYTRFGREEINDDRRKVSERLGVKPENLKYIGVQNILDNQYLHLWNIEQAGHPKNMSTVTGEKRGKKIGEPFVAEKPLRHIEIETKPGMKRTDEWKIKEALKENSNEEKPPKYLNAKWKKDINKELHEISTTYHTEFPIDKIYDLLKKRGVVVLQEDGTEFSGFFIGDNAQTTFQLAPIGSKHWIRTVKGNVYDANTYEGYTPFKNTALVMGWYKMPSGKYEMTTYVG